MSNLSKMTLSALLLLITVSIFEYKLYPAISSGGQYNDSLIIEQLDSNDYEFLQTRIHENLYSFWNYLYVRNNINQLNDGLINKSFFAHPEFISPLNNEIYVKKAGQEYNYREYLILIYHWYHDSYKERIYFDKEILKDSINSLPYKMLGGRVDTARGIINLGEVWSAPRQWDTSITLYTPLLWAGLVGYNKKEKEIVFISGFMFLNNIINEYFKDGINNESIKSYIKLRYYNYSPDIVEINKFDENAYQIKCKIGGYAKFEVKIEWDSQSGYKDSVSKISYLEK